MVHRLRLLPAPRFVSHLLPIAALLSLPCGVPAQQETVQRETQRRLSMAQEAESLAAEGDAAMAAEKSAEAVNRYSAALDRIAPASSSLAVQRQSVVERFADASVTYAKELAERGELAKARLTLQAVLDDRAAPGYAPARTMLGHLDDPDRFNPAQSPRHFTETKKVRDLFILAQGNVDIADYKAAKEAYSQILAVDETNTAARRGAERVEKLINNHLRAERDYTRSNLLNEVDRQWETSVPAGTNLPGSTRSSGEALSGGTIDASARMKLQTLTLDRVAMADSPIQEALSYLARKSIDLDTTEPDPNRKGVNIVFNSAGRAPGDFTPVTLDLRNQTLGDALRAITDQSQTRFSTEGNTITVSPLGVGSRIVSRTFRVPPGFLTKTGSASVDAGAAVDPFATGGAANATSGLKITRMSAKDWLVQNGVPFPEGTTADYSAGSNTLIVRNTEENLELVQTAVDSTTDKSQRQVKIQVVLLKAENRRLQELGMDWLLGPSSVGGGVFAAGGTNGNASAGNAGDFPLQYPDGSGAIGRNPVTAGLRGAFDLQTNPTIDSIIANGTAPATSTSSRSPALLSTAGVFTSPQFQGILRGLNQKKGIDVSIGQTIVLKAGQRATAASTRTIRFPTEFDPPQIPQTIEAPTLRDLTTGLVFTLPSNSIPPVTPTTPQSFEDKETGSSIEVEATVGDDGITVDLNLSVVFREFDGFINFGTPITSGGAVLTDNRILQPVFTAINETAQLQIYDGATVTIGGLSDAKFETINDKVPLLGDIPFLGRLFRSSVNQVTQRAIIYFVTVQVVDPGGVGIQEAAAAAEEAAAAAPGP